MRETLDGIATKRESLQFVEDVPRQGAAPLLQGPTELREPLANEAVEEIIVRPAKLCGHRTLWSRLPAGSGLFFRLRLFG